MTTDIPLATLRSAHNSVNYIIWETIPNDASIKNIDDLIGDIVCEVYGLTDNDVEIVEEMTAE